MPLFLACLSEGIAHGKHMVMGFSFFSSHNLTQFYCYLLHRLETNTDQLMMVSHRVQQASLYKLLLRLQD